MHDAGHRKGMLWLACAVGFIGISGLAVLIALYPWTEIGVGITLAMLTLWLRYRAMKTR